MNTLGEHVHLMLEAKGIETPLLAVTTDEHQKLIVVEDAMIEIMTVLGLDLRDDSLSETPRRVAKMFIREIFAGLDYANFPKCTLIENKFRYDEMIVVDNINLQSVCEHHFVTISGFCTVAYIPNKKVLGLSKINRIVKFFSQRPQVQERLTEQIHATIKFICETDDVAVLIRATHFCVKQRGVQDQVSDTTTSKLSGAFRDTPECRNEFMSIANNRTAC